ncbi:MAG: hypothetical protein KGH63_03500, partial [Candidatus Micrarchaeota archaeon]|nr:hypothetical protein [Candidatus Micrarchaeota archaeon]
IVKPVSLGEFLEADEVFLAGTAAEVAVVRRLYAPQTRAKELLERGVMPAGHFEAGSRRILSAHYHYASGKRENVELMPFDLDKKSKGEVGRLAGDYQDIARARRMGDFGHLLAEVPGRPSEWAMGQMRQVRQRIGAPQSQAVPAGGALVQRKQ